MPKVRPIHTHSHDSASHSGNVLERPGVVYRNHYVVLKNGPDKFSCGHCGEIHAAIRVGYDKSSEPEIRKTISLDRDGVRVVHHEHSTFPKDLVFTEYVAVPDADGFYRSENNRNFEVVAFRCKACNAYVAAPEVQFICERNKDSTPNYLIWAEAQDLDEDKVRLVWINRRATAWNNKLQYKVISHAVVINTRTGQSYLLPPYRDGKPIKEYKGPKLRTITYTANGHMELAGGYRHKIPKEIIQQLIDLVQDKIKSRLGYSPNTIAQYLQDYTEEKLKRLEEKRLRARNRRANYIPMPTIERKSLHQIENIVMYNRFPNMNPFFMFDLIAASCRFRTIKKKLLPGEEPEPEDEVVPEGEYAIVKMAKASETMNQINPRISKVKNNDPDPVGKFLQVYKLPSNKTFRKYLRQDINNLRVLSAIWKNFREIANVKKLLECELYHGRDLTWLTQVPHHLRDVGNPITVSQLISMMVKEQGETIIANKLSSDNDNDLIRDACNAYNAIKNKKPDFVPDFQGTMKEIHDRLSEIHDLLQHENYPLEYAEAEKDIECIIGDYQIYLARDTQELRNVGRIMGICVGSYADRAFNKALYIALVINLKDKNKYCVCIEMDKNQKMINQAKLHSNDRVCQKPEIEAVINEWVEKNNLLVASYDMSLREEHAQKVAEYRKSAYKPVWIREAQQPIIVVEEQPNGRIDDLLQAVAAG